MTDINVIDQFFTEHGAMYQGDCVELVKGLPDESIDFTLTSIPFSDQYTYSPSKRDMGNNVGDEGFFQHLEWLIPELLRVTKPGHLCAIHCKDRLRYISKWGTGGMNPFSDEVTRAMHRHGWQLCANGRITIATDPVRERSHTNRLGLRYKDIREDATLCAPGFPEYLMVYRKWQGLDGKTAFAPERVTHSEEDYPLSRWQLEANAIWQSDGFVLPTREVEQMPAYDHAARLAALQEGYDLVPDGNEWRRVLFTGGNYNGPRIHTATPWVWPDINRMDTRNLQMAKEKGDEKHICLARGSLVLTHEHGYIPIESVSVGDLVLTHKGRWKPVTSKRCNGVNPIIQTTGQGVADLRTTPDHKLWVRMARTKHPRRIAMQTEPAWVEARQTLGSYVNLKLPPVEESALTEHEWWVIGRWLGDGHRDTRGRLHISCNYNETAALVERLGDMAGAVADTNTSNQIAIKDRSGRLRNALARFGNGATGKKLPGEALCLDPVKAEALLSGYLSADGHYTPQYDRWSATSVSRPLLLGMAMVAQRARGVVASVYAGRVGGEYMICNRAVRTCDEWVMSIPPANMSGMILDDGAWKKVRRLEDAGEEEVWDIAVADDESFTAEGCIVHNCPLQLDLVERAIDLWTNKGDVVLDPFAGIGSVPGKAIEMGRIGVGFELKQSYFRYACKYVDEAERMAKTETLFGMAL